MKFSAIVVQFPVTLSIQGNLDIIDSVIAQAKVGDLLLFPEGSLSGYSPDTAFLHKIDPRRLEEALSHIQQESKQRKINTWIGACVNENGKWFNAAYGFSANGRVHIYHKVNLAQHERSVFSVGDSLPVYKLETPDGEVVIGVQICRELRFPEQWGWLARCGAQVILHLNYAVGDDTYQPVWRSHLVSRAAETQRFVLSANNAAPKQISPTMAIAPDGRVLEEAISAKLEILRIDLDLSQVSNHYLSQCRDDIVTIEPKDQRRKSIFEIG